MTNLDSIFKGRGHYFTNKGLSSQSYDFSSSQVWIRELNYKESQSLQMVTAAMKLKDAYSLEEKL